MTGYYRSSVRLQTASRFSRTGGQPTPSPRQALPGPRSVVSRYVIRVYYLNCAPSQVCPNFQPLPTAFLATTVRPSLVVTANVSAPLIFTRTVHRAPQLRYMLYQPVDDPLILTDLTSPAPPTLWISTIKNHGLPPTVNRIPPRLAQRTLANPKPSLRKCTPVYISISKHLTGKQNSSPLTFCNRLAQRLLLSSPKSETPASASRSAACCCTTRPSSPAGTGSSPSR
jgi:hypothetical protein